ncbi:MAG: hypothetical protein IJT36_03440 [Alphaproteobacteria bacterium]|nr:hypothetical protein [Alphaproteobacteria bacterium]
MAKTKEDYSSWSLDALKQKYIVLCFGAMIYGANTKLKRRKISAEIDRRESK